ncbi:MAG: EAL domain-containing protein [Gammaproteobacteria bacterium]|nr:EAL domain-containing protein [Gammaproteobacteria bacterium]
MEKRYIRKSGDFIWIQLTASLVKNDDGSPKYFISVIEDIHQRKLDEVQLHKLSIVVEQSPNPIMITDLDTKIEYVNAAFNQVSGYSSDEALGKTPQLLKSGETPIEVYQDMWAHLLRGEVWRGELTNQRKDGSVYDELAIISPVRDANGTITNYLGIKENITEKKHAEARIQQLAYFDQLTGLPNRSQLIDRFNSALSFAQRNTEKLALMFLDLDHFKNINDTLGHSIGDKLLVKVAHRLKRILREEDTLSRLGGDEFILLLPNTEEDEARQIAIKLIEAIALPFQLDQYELGSTLSIGIAIYPLDGEDFETLLRNADTAMYRVKQAARNDFCFFTEEMQLHSARALKLLNALRHALARNELQLHYQPQIELVSGRVIGAEALLRWNNAELGMISPAEFIPIAEESGLILPIGEWVLRSAVTQMKRWMDDGLAPIVVAVNLSVVQFRHPNLTDLVTRILKQAGLPAQYLELELTEAVAMKDPQGAIGVMNRLHEQGIQMSIDDFGTGYSSLSYLKKFKIAKLKIDQSFVRDIIDDPDDRAIVVAIINLARSLGIQTLAEGVETEHQQSLLQAQGCDEVQGYYYSRPLPADQFEAYVRNKTGLN